MMLRSTLAIFACLTALAGANSAAAEDLARRWVYLQMNLQVAENVDKAEAILRRAAKAGYNGVVLADYKLNILDRVPQHYFTNVARFQKICEELKLEIVPTVCPLGYSDGLLAHDVNLAEGLPVRDAAFVVQGGRAELASAGKNLLKGGDFEKASEHAAIGWSFQDFPGQASFIDREIKHGGASSLRFENLRTTSAPAGNGRVSLRIKARPWQQLHGSVWIKTSDFDSASSVRMMAIGADGRMLSHSNLGVKPTQDWTEHQVMINTLENEEITFYVGCWSGGKGKIWFDDAQLREVAFVNMVRRAACPLVVKTTAGRELIEGRDFDELRDEKLGNVPYAGSYDVYHAPPTLQLRPEAKLKDGDELRISYYHTVTIYDNQVTCCLADPGVFKILERQIRSVDKLLAPKTYFMSHDEIRVANWCPACRKEGRTAGELLASNVRRCAEIVRETSPQATLCVWSDMFDPHHNAAGDKFYLVNGDLSGSWAGLDKNVVVINWNSEKAAKSLPFFDKRGHKQVLAGYYDANPRAIRTWLDAGKESRGIEGAMYTTWTDNFDHLEAFAAAAWGKN